MTVWVENPNGGAANLELQAKTDSGTVVCSDKVSFHAYRSVVIVIGGEDQTPADPPNANFSTFLTAVELYEQGYDVHMFDEDTLNGAIYNEASRAVRFRNVTQMAIIGYSHGGGATHDLSEALANDPNVGAFQLLYTAYVDAVAEPGIAEENRRPVNSLFHVNYYQTPHTWAEDRWLGGGPIDPPGANIEVNVSATAWGAALTHFDIDDNANVRNGVRNELVNHINPW